MSTADHSTTPVSADVPMTDVSTADASTSDDAAQVRQLRILGGPDWLAADDEGVWVKLDDGELQLVDPETASVVASVKITEAADPGCQGNGFGFGSIWTCAGTDVVRVDPVTRTIQTRLPLNKASTQGHLVAYADRMWVLTGTGDRLLGVDPATEQIVTTIALPWRASDVAAGDAGLWAVASSDGHVMKIDADIGAVVFDVAVVDAVTMTVGTQVWVGAKSKSVQLDAGTGNILTTIPTGTGIFGSITSDGESVWVRNTTEFLTQFDAASGAVVATHTASVTSGGDILLAFGYVWTTAFDDSTLFAIALG